ncbi:hypothetical protein EMCRGX_G010368 [Ephydatia muelleri]
MSTCLSDVENAVIGDFVHLEAIQSCEREYEQRLAANSMTVEVKFTYAWHLIKSQYKNDITKGIGLMSELVKHKDQRDFLYYIAVGYYKLEDYIAAADYVDRILDIEANNSQAKLLKSMISKKQFGGSTVISVLTIQHCLHSSVSTVSSVFSIKSFSTSVNSVSTSVNSVSTSVNSVSTSVNSVSTISSVSTITLHVSTINQQCFHHQQYLHNAYRLRPSNQNSPEAINMLHQRQLSEEYYDLRMLINGYKKDVSEDGSLLAPDVTNGLVLYINSNLKNAKPVEIVRIVAKLAPRQDVNIIICIVHLH